MTKYKCVEGYTIIIDDDKIEKIWEGTEAYIGLSFIAKNKSLRMIHTETSHLLTQEKTNKYWEAI